jgi:hypothetical protein
LVRAERDRLLEDGQGHLWDYLESQPVAAWRPVHVPKRHNRPAREALLELRFTAVELRAPKRKRGLGAVGIWAVYVKEVSPPSAKEAIEWMLLTTAAVSSVDDAQQRVDWYKQRWRIEEYHRTLKSGCRIENRQLGDRTDWEKCLAIDLVVAWRIEHMKRQSRETPNAPCTMAFEDHEWRALLAFKRPGQPLPAQPPCLREITRLTAELGGFLGRKGDGEPGSTTLWRGLQRLQDIAAAWLLFTEQPPMPQCNESKPTVSSHTDYG